MTYRAEAIIPLETGFPTLKISTFSPNSNDNLLERGLDLIEERRENAMVQLAYYQHKLKQGYDAKVTKATSAWWLGIEESPGHSKKPSMGKVMTQLGRTISHHICG